jgi:predicted XRE-type DNA-binding protein
MHFVAYYPCDKPTNLQKKMLVDQEIITKIQRGLSAKNMTQAALAEKLGWHRANVSKLLNGKIDNLSNESIDIINDVLAIDLFPIIFRQGTVSATALKLSEMAKSDPKFAELLECVLDVSKPKLVAFLPQIDTKKLPKIGAEVTRIVMKWEEGTDPHYSKIAVEVLDFLRGFYTKTTK